MGTTGRIRESLREQTASLHAKAEAAHWTAEGFAHFDAYRQFLWALTCAHSRFGLPAATCLHDPNLVGRERAMVDLLGQDLGLRSQDSSIPTTLPDRAYAWGVSYTLAGSMLGAVTIRRAGAVPPQWPSRYLDHASSLVETGAVRVFMNNLECAQPDILKATHGAAAVFNEIAEPSRPLPISEDFELSTESEG